MEDLDPVPMTWRTNEKMRAMERWLPNVLRDQRLSKGATTTAAALMFGFNSESGWCWLKARKIGEMIGLSESAVKNALGELERAGHIMRSKQTIRGKAMRVIQPVLNMAVADQEPRKRRGGVAKGVDPRTRAQAARKPIVVPARSVRMPAREDAAAMERSIRNLMQGADRTEPQLEHRTEREDRSPGWGTELELFFGAEVQSPAPTEVQAPCISEPSESDHRYSIIEARPRVEPKVEPRRQAEAVSPEKAAEWRATANRMMNIGFIKPWPNPLVCCVSSCAGRPVIFCGTQEAIFCAGHRDQAHKPREIAPYRVSPHIGLQPA